MEGSFLAASTRSKRVEQVGCAPAAFAPAQVVQICHQPQVLFTGEQFVHRRELAGDPDGGADRVWLPGQVVPGDLRLATIGTDERG